MKDAPKRKRLWCLPQSLGKVALASSRLSLASRANTVAQSSDKSSFPTMIAWLIWLGMIVASTLLMATYTNSAGQAGSPPLNWPGTTRIPRDKSRPNLIMFVHPRCPCSRASVGELALLMAHCQGSVNAYVIFFKPAKSTEDWALTDLWRAATVIPGVTVLQDDAGFEARQFRTETSGDTVLYSAGGHLLFHGGLTISRGHSGDNAGRSALQILLHDQSPQETQTPVFGCSLF